MREIEFRAWHVSHNSMVYFDWVKVAKDSYQMQHLCDLLAGTHSDGKVMQYTGLKDANGVKIFEGDILSHALGSVEGVVSFWEGSFICGISISDNALVKYNTPKYVKIIGNIYENPELLRGGA